MNELLIEVVIQIKMIAPPSNGVGMETPGDVSGQVPTEMASLFSLVTTKDANLHAAR